jgi:hypothetical protein
MAAAGSLRLGRSPGRPVFQAQGNKIKAGRNKIKARRNKIKADRNKIQIQRNKIQIGVATFSIGYPRLKRGRVLEQLFPASDAAGSRLFLKN